MFSEAITFMKFFSLVIPDTFWIHFVKIFKNIIEILIGITLNLRIKLEGIDTPY